MPIMMVSYILLYCLGEETAGYKKKAVLFMGLTVIEWEKSQTLMYAFTKYSHTIWK